ncbi:SsrA-binding protein SmpB [Maricaulis salignorans]|uniref:SsrA-binding protein n=1 Tax=Maricaulis salignorans TaxID=144026 RepID=A0A1G9PG25_9PROT|nr:SsrA-binding protein SmpB [Maricaulis salignorans]SDL97523.1 SsrA-binding protein [Maricaulis salignorans]|tara:strand:+ start:35687 stop:36151 length:465 start_codon:yes stop_codon:yes gene_type:complete
MSKPDTRPVALNRRARYDYEIEETFEAGLMLMGSEVKSLREGRANIAESYVSPEREGLWLINADIPQYAPANRFNHDPRRHRKLLLKKKEISRLIGAVTRDGRTIIALKLYFNDRGIAKLQIGLAKGKRNVDKRQTIKDREWNKQKSRLMKDHG